MTLRQWALDGKIPFTWVGRERRFSCVDVEDMTRGGDSTTVRSRLELLYVRVSGSSGQEFSLEAQEAELRATSTGEIVKVVEDRGSGLKENRPGLNRVLAMVSDGSVSVVRVTHEDRLARFGVGWLKRLFAVYGVTVEVLHPKKLGGRDELLEDFVCLATTFAGRLYGMRSADNRRRLLTESGQCSDKGRVW
ncbi:IS607 family transposase [Streptomyces sp. NPDC046931]|uniref:IS607 family transposase n=1 Tax=Streptomyces sp. NPDC046931 TaxID=3154806 RepID=UPI0033D1F184